MPRDAGGESRPVNHGPQCVIRTRAQPAGVGGSSTESRRWEATTRGVARCHTGPMIEEIAGATTGGFLADRLSRWRETRRVHRAEAGKSVAVVVWFSRQSGRITTADLPVPATSKTGVRLENWVLNRSGGHPPVLGDFGAFWTDVLLAADAGELQLSEHGGSVQFIRFVHGSQVVLEVRTSDWSLIRRCSVNGISPFADDHVA